MTSREEPFICWCGERLPRPANSSRTEMARIVNQHEAAAHPPPPCYDEGVPAPEGTGSPFGGSVTWGPDGVEHEEIFDPDEGEPPA